MARKNNRRSRFLALILTAPLNALANPSGAPERTASEVTLRASAESVAPGQPFDLAFHFKLPEGWHIYWKNSGEGGIPPTVRWSLPEGFSAGELQFPVPKRHVDTGAIETNVLVGEPVLLARMTPPQAISVAKVELSAEVEYLVCGKKCFRERAKLAQELPVMSVGHAPTPANQDLFRRARSALPKETSQHLRVTASTKPSPPAIGQKFDLLLDVDIQRAYHIQSHEPLNPNFIRCDVFLERAADVLFEKPEYPEPRFRTLKHVGKVSEYAGRIAIRIPGQIDAGAAAIPQRLGGLLKYQACDEKGTCFPPDALAFSVALGSGKQALATPVPSPAVVAERGVQEPGASGEPDRPSAGRTDTGAVQSVGENMEPAASGTQPRVGFLDGLGLAGLLLGCFLYGVSINATPCVLPLLSIKVLGFVQQAHQSRRRTTALGLSFGAGVIVFFVVLGFLASTGRNVLQYPAAVIGLGTVVTAMALSMLGVYTLQVPTAATKLDEHLQQEGLWPSFGKGALAPVLGFACTAPLLAAAFGWATQQPAHRALLGFLSAGLGMASPYMVLGANPRWLGFLPKPGPWMVTFERVVGFVLLAMVIWLVHPLVQQLGPEGLEWTLIFFVAVAMGCWLLGKIQITMPATQRWRYRGGAATLVAATAMLVYGWVLDRPPVHLAWQPWSAEAVEQSVRGGQIAFVDFTTAYCTQCKANKAVAIETPEVSDKLIALGAVPFQGDFTSGDPEIFAALQRFGHAGVPLNLIYPAGRPNEPVVLATQLTKAYLLDKLDEAAASSVAAPVTRAGP